MPSGPAPFASLVRGRIVSEMLDWFDGRRKPVVDVHRHPIPRVRPDPDAQWDEVRATWVEWDESSNCWVDVDVVASQPSPVST